MPLQQNTLVLKFFQTALMDSDPENDQKTFSEYISTLNTDVLEQLEVQFRNLLQSTSLPLDEFGAEANRWFGDESEARQWLENLVSVFKSSGAGALVVKDSNGTLLQEGDSVTVIKDLKVKGGSSDLKRGDLIKKIHLTPDPAYVECRVNGSTLVLKTEFLKKS